MAHDPAVESWLKENGYAFRFEKNAALDRIDLAEAASNPARLQRKFDDDLAWDYAKDYEKGADFPALTVQEIIGEKLWRLWGGAHRIGGATMALKNTHDMIVVFGETSEARIELARRVLNSRGVGKKDTMAEKLQHIAELRKRWPRQLPLDDLATHFKVKRPTITRYLAVVASQERAERLGKGLFWSNPKISQELKVETGRLSDEVFVAVVELVQNHQADLRGETGTDFVKKLRTSMQNDSTRLAAIIDRDKELHANDEERRTGRKRVPTSKTTRFLGYFRSIGAAYPGTPEKLHLGDQGSCATLRRLKKEQLKVQDICIEMVAEYDRLIAEAEKVEAWRAARRGGSDSAGISPPP